MMDIRREERMALMQKRSLASTPVEEESSRTSKYANNLSHLDKYGDMARPMKEKVERWLDEGANEDDMPEYVRLIVEGDIFQKHEGAIKLRKCLSAKINTPIQSALDLNILPYLVEMMRQEEHPYLQIEGAWCITNMATGSHLQVLRLVEKGVVPVYIQLLTKDSLLLVEQAVWGIGNISGDCPEYRDLFVQNNAIRILADLYERTKRVNESLSIDIIWACSNLCRTAPYPPVDKTIAALSMFASALKETKKVTTTINCIWGLLSMTTPSTLHHLENAGVVECIVSLLKREDVMVTNPALKIISTFSAADSTYTKLIVNYGVIDGLAHLLGNHIKAIKKLALLCLSNLAAGESAHVQSILTYPSLLSRILNLSVTADEDNKLEATWCICNCCKSGNTGQIEGLLKSGIIEIFGDKLDNSSPPAMLGIVIEAFIAICYTIRSDSPDNFNELIQILFDKGIIDKIEALQQHKNNYVYSKAYKFITSFLEVDKII